MTDEMTIGAMCKAYGVTPRTLRFYEAKELLFPRREGQKRLFTRSDQARLRLILRGKRFGFSLEDIRQLLSMYDRDDQENTQLQETLSRAKEQLAKMIAQRHDLDEAIEELKGHMDWISAELNRRGTPLA